MATNNNTGNTGDSSADITALKNQVATLTTRVNTLEAKLEEILNKIVEVF